MLVEITVGKQQPCLGRNLNFYIILLLRAQLKALTPWLPWNALGLSHSLHMNRKWSGWSSFAGAFHLQWLIFLPAVERMLSHSSLAWAGFCYPPLQDRKSLSEPIICSQQTSSSKICSLPIWSRLTLHWELNFLPGRKAMQDSLNI